MKILKDTKYVKPIIFAVVIILSYSLFLFTFRFKDWVLDEITHAKNVILHKFKWWW